MTGHSVVFNIGLWSPYQRLPSSHSV